MLLSSPIPSASGCLHLIDERGDEDDVIGVNVIIRSAYQAAYRGVKVMGRTFERKVEGSSPDMNIIGCRQEGHPDIKWLPALAKSPAMQAPFSPQYWGK